ncbi:MAG: hypothetical protein ACFFDK_15180 [Promethearchaeota archaeon]
MTEPESNKEEMSIDLNPEFRFMMTMNLDVFFKSCKVNFFVETARDRFIIWYQTPDRQIYSPLMITFKQVLRGDLTHKHCDLRYKIRGNLISIFKKWYPEMNIKKYQNEIVEKFAFQINNLALNFIEARQQIELELGPLPQAFSTFLEINLPKTSERLDIIDRNALKMYNEKAQANRWLKIRDLDELAYYISQKLPEYKCSAARKVYRDINEIRQRRKIVMCDFQSIANEISNRLDQLK